MPVLRESLSSSGKASKKPLAVSASSIVLPRASVIVRCQTVCGKAWTTDTSILLERAGASESGGTIAVDVFCALGERIDEAGGNAIEYVAHDGFQRTAGELVFHGVDDFAGIGPQFLKVPVALQG